MRIPDNFSLGKNLKSSYDTTSKHQRSGKNIVMSKLTDDYMRINQSSGLAIQNSQHVNSIFLNQISSSNPNFGKSSEPFEIKFPNQSEGNSQVMSGGSGLSFKKALPKFTLLGGKDPDPGIQKDSDDHGNGQDLKVIGLENIVESKYEKQRSGSCESDDLIQTTESKFVMRTDSGGFQEISHRRRVESIPFEKIVEEPESKERHNSQERGTEDITSLENLQKGYQLVFGAGYPSKQVRASRSKGDSPLERIQEGRPGHEMQSREDLGTGQRQQRNNDRERAEAHEPRESQTRRPQASTGEDFPEVEYVVDMNPREKDSIQRYLDHDPEAYAPDINTKLSQPNDEFTNSKGEPMDLIEYLDKKPNSSNQSSPKISQNPLFKNSFTQNLEPPSALEDPHHTPPVIFNNNLVTQPIETPGRRTPPQDQAFPRKQSSYSRSRTDGSRQNISHHSQNSRTHFTRTQSRNKNQSTQNQSSRTHDSRNNQSPRSNNTKTTKSHQISHPSNASGNTVSKQSKKSKNSRPSQTSNLKVRRRTSESHGMNKYSRRASKHSYQMGTLEHLENYEALEDMTEYTQEHMESSLRSVGSSPLQDEFVKHFGIRKAGTEGFEDPVISEKSVDYLQLSRQHNSSGDNSEKSEKIYYFQGAGSDINENEKLEDFRKNMFRGSDCSEKDLYAVRNENGGFDYFKRVKTTGNQSKPNQSKADQSQGNQSQGNTPNIPRRITKLSLNKRPYINQKSASLGNTSSTNQRIPGFNFPTTDQSQPSPTSKFSNNTSSGDNKKPSSKPSVNTSNQNNLSSMTSQHSEKMDFFCGKSELVLVPDRRPKRSGKDGGSHESVLLPQESVVIGDLQDESLDSLSELGDQMEGFGLELIRQTRSKSDNHDAGHRTFNEDRSQKKNRLKSQQDFQVQNRRNSNERGTEKDESNIFENRDFCPQQEEDMIEVTGDEIVFIPGSIHFGPETELDDTEIESRQSEVINVQPKRAGRKIMTIHIPDSKESQCGHQDEKEETENPDQSQEIEKNPEKLQFNQTFQDSMNHKRERQQSQETEQKQESQERKGKIHFDMDALKREQAEMMLFSNVNQVQQPLGLLSPINNLPKKKIHNPHRQTIESDPLDSEKQISNVETSGVRIPTSFGMSSIQDMPRPAIPEEPSKHYEDRGTQMSRDFLGATEESELDQYLSKYCSKYSIPKNILKFNPKNAKNKVPQNPKKVETVFKTKLLGEPGLGTSNHLNHKKTALLDIPKMEEIKLARTPKRSFQISKQYIENPKSNARTQLTPPQIQDLQIGSLLKENDPLCRVKPELNMLDEKTLSICDKYSRREDSEERSLSFPKIGRGISREKGKRAWNPPKRRKYGDIELNHRARQEYNGKSPSVQSQRQRVPSRDWSIDAPRTNPRFGPGSRQTRRNVVGTEPRPEDQDSYGSKTHTKGFYNPDKSKNIYYVRRSDHMNSNQRNKPRNPRLTDGLPYTLSQRDARPNQQSRFNATQPFDQSGYSSHSRQESSDSSSNQYGQFRSNFRKFRKQFQNLHSDQMEMNASLGTSPRVDRIPRREFNTSKKTREKTLEKKGFESKRKVQRKPRQKSPDTPPKRNKDSGKQSESHGEGDLTEISFHRAVEDLIENSNGRLTFKRRSGGSITKALKDFLKEQTKLKQRSRDKIKNKSKNKRKSNLSSIGTLGESQTRANLQENRKNKINRPSKISQKALKRNKNPKFQSRVGSQISYSGGHPWSRGNSVGRTVVPEIAEYDSVVENVLRASRVYRKKKELHKKLAEVEKQKRELKKKINEI